MMVSNNRKLLFTPFRPSHPAGRTRHHGVTLMEVMLVATCLALVFVVCTKIFFQVNTLHLRTSSHAGPQSAEMLALKRMERDMRQAMFVNIVTPTPSTWVELCMAKRDGNGLNQLVQNEDDGILGLERDANKDVCYFLGSFEYPNPSDRKHWNAVPDVNGHTLFRALSNTATVDGKYPNAAVMIDGILSTPMVPDPANPGQEKAARLFEYWPTDPADPTRPSRDTQLIVVTVTVPVPTDKSGLHLVNHTLRTQYCLRNWNTSQGVTVTP